MRIFLRSCGLSPLAPFLILSLALTPGAYSPQKDVVVEQPPYWNSLRNHDPLDLASACSSGIAPIATSASMGFGKSDSVLLHSGQEDREEFDLFIAGRDSSLCQGSCRLMSRAGPRDLASTFGQA